MFWDHVGGFMKKKKIPKNWAKPGAAWCMHVAWCTWLGARVPCTIVMGIDGCEVYIIMFWDHVGGFVEKQNFKKKIG